MRSYALFCFWYKSSHSSTVCSVSNKVVLNTLVLKIEGMEKRTIINLWPWHLGMLGQLSSVQKNQFNYF